MRFLKALREKDSGSPVAYHLEGLLDACAGIQGLVNELGELYGVNTEATAAKLTDLTEGIYTHLVFHLRELRSPLRQLVDAAYASVPDLDAETQAGRQGPTE